MTAENAAWLAALRAEVARAGADATADRLGVGRVAVARVVRDGPGSVWPQPLVVAAVEHLLGGFIPCPARGDGAVSLFDCAAQARGDAAACSPVALAAWRACLACANRAPVATTRGDRISAAQMGRLLGENANRARNFGRWRAGARGGSGGGGGVQDNIPISDIPISDIPISDIPMTETLRAACAEIQRGDPLAVVAARRNCAAKALSRALNRRGVRVSALRLMGIYACEKECIPNDRPPVPPISPEDSPA